jgi:hypothetical protein
MSGDTAGADLPQVPAALLEGWRQTDQTSETVFELATVSITGHTVVYEDTDLRATVREATAGDYDRMWRFFFATRLTFSPSLPPGVGPMAVFSTVASQANSQFADDLRERGFQEISQGRRERIRVETGDRARLRTYNATLDVETPAGGTMDLDLAGFLAVWTTDGQFRLAGGAYPATPIEDVLGIGAETVDTDPAQFREDLLELIRHVR